MTWIISLRTLFLLLLLAAAAAVLWAAVTGRE
jgi:hypothetical protein